MPDTRVFNTEEVLQLLTLEQTGHRRADEIDARQGLQLARHVAFVSQPVQEPHIEKSNACFDFFHMSHDLVQDKAVTRREFALQDVEQFFPTGFESATGKLQKLLR